MTKKDITFKMVNRSFPNFSKENPLGNEGEIPKRFANLLKAMKSSQDHAFPPRTFKFSENQQDDSQQPPIPSPSS
ncbi:hypothetical protein OUZ56_029323 [Daphnia magna]|uniref:Uncharacterized protein n=1 Tax=Daphnia magna TaxID=35525 RepID=A0ABR0B6G8_9CRUS|nr:hypothetical protein OUZ56_029323 [Daphnia magna]